MRKKILGFVFAAALLAAMAVPLVSGGGTAEAHIRIRPPDDPSNGQAPACLNVDTATASHDGRGVAQTASGGVVSATVC